MDVNTGSLRTNNVGALRQKIYVRLHKIMDQYAPFIDNIVICGDFNLEPDSKNKNFEHLIDAVLFQLY